MLFVCEVEKQGNVFHVGVSVAGTLLLGRAGAIEVKWNRRRSYLVSSNFGFGFCLVLI